MSATLTLLLAVVLAYLAAHVAFDWLARKYLLVSGAEYLLLGILLGPEVSGVLSAETMAGFAPLITLALGWIGAIVGTQFYLPGLVRIPGLMYKLAFFEALMTLGIVAGVEAVVAARLFDLPLARTAAPALALGAIAAVSAPAGIAVASRHLGERGPVVRQLQVATAIDALIGIVVLGLLLCIRHPQVIVGARAMTATEWAVITLAIGVVGGTLFHLFLRGETHTDRIFIALAGAIIFVSGAAAYLHLSPVLAAMIVGATVVNTSRSRDEIAQTLANSERPFYFVLLVFAGAAWQPGGSPWAIVPVVVFLAARVLAKVGGARLAARMNDALPALGPHWGRALLGQGGLAVALALNFSRLESSPLANVVFSAAILSVLITDVASARIIQNVLERVRTAARLGS